MSKLAEQINALPDEIRKYIHDLEACSPADLVQENHALREQLEYTQYVSERASDAHRHDIETMLAISELIDGILRFKEDLTVGESIAVGAYEALRKAYPKLQLFWSFFDGQERPKIICLCGSTKFKDQYLEATWQFTLAGYIVLSVGGFQHADGLTIPPYQKAELDKLHLAKIDLADIVYVIDKGGYIGSSTQREVAHALKRGKRIRYWTTHRIPSLDKHNPPRQADGKQPCEAR